MDTTTKLITGLFALFFFTDVMAYPASGIDLYPNLRMVDGQLHVVKPGGGTSMIYPDIFMEKDIPVNTSKGKFSVPVPRSMPVDTAKVGKAATRLLRTLPAIGTALALYDIACDLAEICNKNGTLGKDDLGYELIPEGVFVGSCTPSKGTSFQPNGSGGFTEYFRAPSSNAAHNAGGPDMSGQGYGSYGFCYDEAVSNFDQTWRKLTVESLPPSMHRPVTEQEWSDAETTLSTGPVAEALFDAGGSVPVSPGTLISPVSHTIATSTSQVRDSGGNVTGTQTTTTTVTITDNSTTTNIEYNITEKTLVEDFDANNQPTGSKETQSDNEPPKDKEPPEDIKIENGKVDEVPLLTETINVQDELDNAQQAEWSVYGSCPADIDLGVYGLEFSLTPFCTFAENMRPIVLMLGAFFSFFILSGAKFN